MKFWNILFVYSMILVVSCTSVTGVDTQKWQELNPDESLLTDQQKKISQHNATLLAFREMYKEDKNFIDISQPLIEGYYKALTTILTSEAGQQVEVIQELRAFDYRNLNSIIVEPRPEATFLENWEDSVIVTNIMEIDNLLADRGFKIESINDFSFSEQLYFVVESEKVFNTLRISELLQNTGHFSLVEINGWCCDGGDIEVEETEDGHKFTFINAYGDCPSGCINHDKYIFMLSNNGTVQYLGTQ